MFGTFLGVFLFVFNKSRLSLKRSFNKQILGAESPSSTAKGGESDALRDFGLGAQILADLGCRKIRLMSNSDRKIVGIQGFGIEVTRRIRIPEPDQGAQVIALKDR